MDIKEDRAIINLVQLLQMLYINICMAVNTFDVDVCQQQVFPWWTVGSDIHIPFVLQPLTSNKLPSIVLSKVHTNMAIP